MSETLTVRERSLTMVVSSKASEFNSLEISPFRWYTARTMIDRACDTWAYADKPKGVRFRSIIWFEGILRNPRDLEAVKSRVICA